MRRVRLAVTPGGPISGEARVPGDKSIAHRWLILAALARGRSTVEGLQPGLDVLATARCLASFVPRARPGLEVWARNDGASVEGGGSTWNGGLEVGRRPTLEVEGDGRDGRSPPPGPLDCANSGTTMRLLCGVLAAAPFEAVLTGDRSLATRPMERVAAPLRGMGAVVETTDGHAPLRIAGRPLHGVDLTLEVPSAQVKSAILLAGLEAEGATSVREPVPTRDHTERALQALGATIDRSGDVVTVRPFQHEGFEARVPGDLSSAVFLIAAAAVTGGEVVVEDVGLNPSRTRVLDVFRRMGVVIDERISGTSLGEPFGRLEVRAGAELRPVRVDAAEVPLVHDEIPALAAVAAHAPGDSWFLGAAELRVKESDRLIALAEGLRTLGGVAADEGDDLVVGGGGLTGGGTVASGGDHRIAMAMAVAGLAAARPVEVLDAEVASVSFPGFATTLGALGARVEARP